MKNETSSEILQAQQRINELKKKQSEQQIVLQKEIDAQQAIINANTPKPIAERVNNSDDIFSIAGIDKNEKLVTVTNPIFDEVDKRTLEFVAKKIIACKVLNEGELPKKNRRYFTWNRLAPVSGLVFYHSNYNGDHATTGSAARLSLKNDKLAQLYGKTCMDIEEGLCAIDTLSE